MRTSLVVSILALAFAFSIGACTKKSDKPVTDAAPAVTPSEPGNDVSDAPPSAVPKIEGLEVTGEKFEPQDASTFLVDELKVADSSGKALDQFPILDWGPVKIVIEGQTLHVYPNGDDFKIDYKVDADKKVSRSTSCKFEAPPESKYKDLVATTKAPGFSWENFYQVGMADLASAGNKSAYDFFVNPNAEAKKLRSHAKSADSFEPVVRVLKFMKANGCSW